MKNIALLILFKLFLTTCVFSQAITDTGSKVGIGTASPQTELHVAGNVRFDGNTFENDRIQFESQNGFHRIAFNQLRFYDWDSGTDNLTINDKKVGIGTASPTVRERHFLAFLIDTN